MEVETGREVETLALMTPPFLVKGGAHTKGGQGREGLLVLSSEPVIQWFKLMQMRG